jgi:hypothetical protein
MGSEFGGEIVARARLVLDDELLAKMLGEILPDQASADVRRSTGRIADQPAHAVVRIIIGARRAGLSKDSTGNDDTDESDGKPPQKSTGHFLLPSRSGHGR